MPKNTPSYKHMWLYRTGLKIEVSQNFIDKFIEIYNDLLTKRQWKEEPKKIDDNTARFMVGSIIESIIYCLDFGLDVWINRCMVFVQKTLDKRQYNRYNEKCTVQEDLRWITIRPIQSMIRKIKYKMNENNVEYNKFLQQKTENHKKIKDYYKEFYAKEEDWWQPED